MREPSAAAACLRGSSDEELLRAWTGGAFVVGGAELPVQPARALATDNRAQIPAGGGLDPLSSAPGRGAPRGLGR